MAKLIANWPSSPEDWVRTNEREIVALLKLNLIFTDTDGISIQGLSLILAFDALAPHDGAAILRFSETAGTVHLGRFDFGAQETHSNQRARNMGSSTLSAIVRGAHLHGFAINEKFGHDAFGAKNGCPPAAVALDPQPVSFRERMRVIGEEFSIQNLDKLPPPPFQGDLLR